MNDRRDEVGEYGVGRRGEAEQGLCFSCLADECLFLRYVDHICREGTATFILDPYIRFSVISRAQQ